MTRRTTKTFRDRLSGKALEMANLIRRVVFGDTSGGQWGTEGYETGDGIEGDGAEPTDVYQGLYMYARPAADDNAEGLMLSIGASSNNPAVAALRNEDARRRYVEEFGDLSAGELAIFNSAGKTRVHITAAGDVLIEADGGQEVKIRTNGGSTDSLITKSEFDNHGHPTAALGPVSPPIASPGPALPPAFPGTQVLKAE